LVKEWEEHQGLWKADPPPYRAAPGHWRRYQSALLRADRWVRFAWHDDDALDEAGALLGEAVKARDDLNKALKDEADREKAFPFRPVSGSSSDEGARMLNHALRWLTDKRDRAVAVLSGEEPATKKGPEADKQAGRGGAKAMLEAAENRTRPAVFDEFDSDGWFRYLELQLPRWADRFHTEFQRKVF